MGFYPVATKSFSGFSGKSASATPEVGFPSSTKRRRRLAARGLFGTLAAAGLLTIAIPQKASAADVNVGANGTITLLNDDSEAAAPAAADLVGDTIIFNAAGGTINLGGVAGGAGFSLTNAVTGITMTNAGTIETIGVSSIGTVISGAGAVTFDSTNNSNNSITLSGTNTATGQYNLTATTGTLTLQLTGAQATLAYTVGESTTLLVGAANVIADGATIVNSGTFDVDNNETVGSISGAGTIDIDAAATLTFGDANDTTISGVIAGAGTLVKQGESTVTLTNASGTHTGETIINAGTLKLGADGAIRSGNTVTVNAGSLDLGGYFNPTLNVALRGGTINGGTGGKGQLSGTLSSTGGTITNVSGDAAFTQIRGTTTITGDNQFNGVTMNGGTIATTITGGGEVPIRNTGGFEYNGGVLTVDASGVTAKTGTWTVISGSVDEALARNTEVTFQGKTLKFEGFDAPIAGYALYDLYLKKGSLQFVSDRKSATDVCGITGLCDGGYLKGSLDGADKDAVAGVVRDVLMPSYEAGDLSLDFYTTQENLSKFVISGLMPRNVDAAGNSLANYNELLADTLFDRQPLRKFKVAEVVSEVSAVEAVETSAGDVVAEGVEVASASTEVTEDPSLAAQYLEDDKWGAWVKGFGGDYNNDGEGTYVYRDYSATFGGVMLGVDYEVASDVRVGAYANNGYISMSQSSGDYSGSGSWNPTGWGGGITASYTKPNFYVQGLFGASGFSGTQKRSLVASTIAAAQTIEAEKDVTSFIGSLRFGAPVELGKFVLDPQLQATWTGNQESAFNESTGGNAKLSYASRSTNFLQTELGAKLTMPINLGKKSEIVPNIRVAWLGDWGINGEGQQVGYSFTNRTATIDSENQNDMGVLIEGGVDYTIANTDSVSYKVYALGGVELFNNTGGTGWRASGGVKFNF